MFDIISCKKEIGFSIVGLISRFNDNTTVYEESLHNLMQSNTTAVQ